MSLLRGRKSCWWIPEQIRQRGHNQAHDHFWSIRYETQSVVLARIERRISLCLAVRTGRKCVGMWNQLLSESRTGLHQQIFILYASSFPFPRPNTLHCKACNKEKNSIFCHYNSLTELNLSTSLG